jgi:hypothetical protein
VGYISESTSNGVVIQVDIDDHPPIPTSSHTYVILVVSVFILVVFSRFLDPELMGLL